jgi:hypothetical protein
MNLEDSFREFVRLSEAGETLAALERCYAEDVVVFENREQARSGRDTCVAHERAALSRVSALKLRARATAIDTTRGVSFIEWTIRFVTPEGRAMLLEEVAVQHWSGGQIVQERFYYEGVVDEGDIDEPV